MAGARAKGSFLFAANARAALPASVDLRTAFPNSHWPVEDQGRLGSCTAQAVVGLAEYLIFRGCGERTDLSRLFLYKATRRLLGWAGDTGAYIRTTIRAMAQFGVPEEAYWPYDIARFDEDPDAFLYASADEFQAVRYARFDGYAGGTGGDTLRAVRAAVADGWPVAFGFPVYSSFDSADPDVPFPDLRRNGDRLVGGHAVLAVGYDDERPVVHADPGAPPERGALLIRNSWGPLWGDEGYGWLPYRYVEEQLAVDFWTIFNQKWLDGEQFRV
jgi:C1A family cysteine protease